MEPIAHEERGVGDWIARFVGIARRMQMATAMPAPSADPALGSPSKLPEDKRKAAEELSAILLPLRANLTQAQIEQLLYDDDPDVRLAAALTLGAKNDELRLAAIASAWRGLSMAETLANRRRARSKPPSSPRLDEMSAGALVERFVDAGERKALADRFLEWGTVKADGRTCDRLIDEINEVHDRLKARGWLERLKPLMDHGNPRVRLSAALKCLGLDETKAVVTLENLQKTGGFREKDEARLNLSLWRKSRSREGADSVSGGPTQSSVN